MQASLLEIVGELFLSIKIEGISLTNCCVIMILNSCPYL